MTQFHALLPCDDVYDLIKRLPMFYIHHSEGRRL
jgi:hypothetical protein